MQDWVKMPGSSASACQLRDRPIAASHLLAEGDHEQQLSTIAAGAMLPRCMWALRPLRRCWLRNRSLFQIAAGSFAGFADLRIRPPPP